MKKLIVLSVLFLASCSESSITNTDDCECNKNIYYKGEIINSEYYSNDCADDGTILLSSSIQSIKIECK